MVASASDQGCQPIDRKATGAALPTYVVLSRSCLPVRHVGASDPYVQLFYYE
jgi:hypothetical protein